MWCCLDRTCYVSESVRVLFDDGGFVDPMVVFDFGGGGCCFPGSHFAAPIGCWLLKSLFVGKKH
ncbi:hypothetical protein A2U01_0079478, partial [Trifolium medium]|nr:hypothetical protein [Trifolium medium]